jgi:uncharacterized protein YkwD
MRKSFARRLALIVLLPAAFFGTVVVASPAQAAPTTTQMQSDIVYWTNQHRAKAGCAKVRLDVNLARAARNHSAWMAKKPANFSHVGQNGSTFVTRAKAAGYATPRSENIAWGYRTGAAVVSAWMKSPGHKANIVDCTAKAQGVGVVYAANGTPYITQDFGSK